MLPHLHDLTFPARDERLAPLIARLSEPTNSPAADNFVSNEDSYPRVASDLARRVKPNGVFLGVGPDQNFTLIAHARPALAFIVDYRRRNLVLHLAHKALFSLASTRVDYLRRLTSRDPAPLPPDPTASQLVSAFQRVPFNRDVLHSNLLDFAAVLRPLDVLTLDEFLDLSTILTRLAGPGLSSRFLALPMYPTMARLVLTPDRDNRPTHLLALESHYQALRALQLADRIIPLTADLAGPAALRRLGDWLRQRSLSITALYLSDVEFFLLRARRYPAFLSNLTHLPLDPSCLLIRTSTREIRHPQRVPGDSSTTILLDAHPFLQSARAGRIQSPDDLFP